MRASDGLRVEQGLLLVLCVALAGLLAVPSSVRDPAPRGAVIGRLLGPRPEALTDVPVLCFAAGAAKPSELVHTDDRGRFAFQAAPARFHVLALPARTSGLAAGWRVDLDAGLDVQIEIALSPSRPIAVLVEDADGRPVPGAEVAAFALGPAGALATDLARTDAAGRAALVVPPRAGLAARADGLPPVLAPVPEGARTILRLPTRR